MRSLVNGSLTNELGITANKLWPLRDIRGMDSTKDSEAQEKYGTVECRARASVIPNRPDLDSLYRPLLAFNRDHLAFSV